MATHTIVTTPEDEEVLRWVVATRNAERGTKLTVGELLQAELPHVLHSYKLRYREAESAAVLKKFQAEADADKRAEVKTLLGVNTLLGVTA